MFLREILNIPKYHSAILFENGKIKIIKIAEKDKNFYPIYWNEIDFDLKSFNEKTDLINFFKKIQENLKTKEIHLDQIRTFSEGELNNITDNLKIAGFEKINLVNWNFNIENLILDKNKIERTIYTFFETNEEIKFYHFENKKIYRIQEVNFSDLNDEAIQEIFKDSYHRHTFVSGYFEKYLEDLQEKFHQNGIKLHVLNSWKNILSFEYQIPSLFKEESHKYIKAISLAIPPLEEISFIKIEKKVKTKNKEKKIKTENEINIDFIIDNKKETKIILERHSFKQILKDFFSKVIWGPKKSKPFKLFRKEEKKKEEKRKLFLPKSKIKLFLPKPKIKNEKNLNKKEKVIFLPKQKILINNKHSFKLVKIKIQKEKKNGKKRKNNKKLFLPKNRKILLLPKPKKKIFEKIWKWLNSPVWKKKDKK